jgi:hypothetical protein
MVLARSYEKMSKDSAKLDDPSTFEASFDAAWRSIVLYYSRRGPVHLGNHSGACSDHAWIGIVDPDSMQNM